MIEDKMDPEQFLPDLLNYIQSRRSVIYGAGKIVLWRYYAR